MNFRHSVKRTETTTIENGKTVTKRKTNKLTVIPNWLMAIGTVALAVIAAIEWLPSEMLSNIWAIVSRLVN